MAFIVQAFADGKVGDILFTSAKIAFANAVNILAGALMAVGQALLTYSAGMNRKKMNALAEPFG